MTVPAQDRFTFSSGNGVTTTFPYTFMIPGTVDDPQFLVYLIEIATGIRTDLTVDVDYSISGLGAEEGGVVTYPLSSAPLPATHRIVIESNMPYEQQTDVYNSGTLYLSAIEDQFDNTTRQVQQIQDRVNRTFSVGIGYAGNYELFPVPDKLIGWNSTGTALENKQSESESAAGAYAAQLAAEAAQVAAEAAAASAANKVSKTGDVMTGNLTIKKAGSQVNLLKEASTDANAIIFGGEDDLAEWAFQHLGTGDATLPQGIAISRRNALGAAIDRPFTVNYITGEVQFGTSDQFASALGGFKWTKAILVASGTDANTLTDSAIYNGEALINGPRTMALGEWVYVEVVRYQGSNANLMQLWHDMNITPQGTLMTTWVRRRTGSIWGAWFPYGGFATLEHWGAYGDGSTDDTNAFIRALRSGTTLPIQLHGNYRITAAAAGGTAYSDGYISLIGSGRQHFTFDGAQAKIEWDIGSLSTYQAPQIIMRDFQIIVPRSDHNAWCLDIAAASGGSGSTTRPSEISNIGISGNSTTTGPAAGILLDNMTNSRIQGCRVQGKRNQTAGSRVNAAILIRGDSDPVDIKVIDNYTYFMASGVQLSNTLEGVTIDRHTAVACDRGVDATFNENPISGDNAGKPLLVVTNSHFNCYVYGIYMQRVRQYSIRGNDIMTEAANTNWNGIRSDQDSSASEYGFIGGNRIKDEFGLSSGTTIGINLEGHTSGVLDTKIDPNIFVSLDIGINLGANAKNVKYAQSGSIFSGVTTVVNNGGGASNTAV